VWPRLATRSASCSDQATYLYPAQGRYWYDLQPSVACLTADRAAHYAAHTVGDEILRRLRLPEVARDRGDFVKVHTCPAGSGDVPDEVEPRLVILSPTYTHPARATDSQARVAAAEILERRGLAHLS